MQMSVRSPKAEIIERGNPTSTGFLLKIQYLDDGHYEDRVPLNDLIEHEQQPAAHNNSGGAASAETHEEHNKPTKSKTPHPIPPPSKLMVDPTMTWFDQHLASDADRALMRVLLQQRNKAAPRKPRQQRKGDHVVDIGGAPRLTLPLVLPEVEMAEWRRRYRRLKEGEKQRLDTEEPLPISDWTSHAVQVSEKPLCRARKTACYWLCYWLCYAVAMMHYWL